MLKIISVQLWRAVYMGHKWKEDLNQSTVHLTSVSSALSLCTSCPAVSVPCQRDPVKCCCTNVVMTKFLAQGDESDFNSEKQWCGTNRHADSATRWTDYSLAKRCHTSSFPTINVAVSKQLVSVSGQEQIRTEDAQKCSWGKYRWKYNNSVRKIPGVNVCN